MMLSYKGWFFSVNPYVCWSLCLDPYTCGGRNCSRRSTVRLGIGTLIANVLVVYRKSATTQKALAIEKEEKVVLYNLAIKKTSV